MGVFRGGGLVIVSVIFLLVVFGAGVTLSLANSLDYENVRSEAVSVVDNLLGQTNFSRGINMDFVKMSSFCVNASSEAEYVFMEPNTGEVLVIPCSVVDSGVEGVISYSRNSFVDKAYYKEYSCGFWDCFSKTESPLFLISKQAQNYWNGKFYYLFIFSVVLFVVMFFLAEKRSNAFIIGGALVIVSVLPLLKLDLLFNWIFGSFLFGIFGTFFSGAVSIFWRFFIVGILAVAIGIITKIFGLGFKISEFFNKFRKKEEPVQDKNKTIIKKDSPPQED